MITGRFDTLDEMFQHAADEILNDCYKSNPRKGDIRARHPFILELRNPRARRLLYGRPNWSLALAFAEFCWHWRAEESVAPLAFYAPSWAKAADANGKIRGSAYGKKIFTSSTGGPSQWLATKNLLERIHLLDGQSYFFLITHMIDSAT